LALLRAARDVAFQPLEFGLGEKLFFSPLGARMFREGAGKDADDGSAVIGRSKSDFRRERDDGAFNHLAQLPDICGPS